jgi:hypothetical protein
VPVKITGPDPQDRHNVAILSAMDRARAATQASADASRAVVGEIKIARDSATAAAARAVTDAAAARAAASAQTSELARMRQIPVNVTVNVSTAVSVSNIQKKTKIITKYGSVATRS